MGNTILTGVDISELEKIAKELRKTILNVIFHAGSGHPGGSLSATDILTAIYFGGILQYDPNNPSDPKRDRFILSKGHASALMYCVLARAGYFSEQKLQEYRKIGSGSLGQGLSVGHGIALGGRVDRLGYKVYVVLGDGEIQEGQIWEAAMSAAKFNSNNLIAIVDNNKVAQDNNTVDLKNIEPLEDKWKSFGWDVHRINGHCMNDIMTALSLPTHLTKPRVIIADTIKGKGVSFMEGNKGWHGVAPKEEDLNKALKELEG
jgi:transketolase